MRDFISATVFHNRQVAGPNLDPCMVMPGDRFATDDQHGRDLVALGFAVDAPPSDEVEPLDVVAAAEAELAAPRGRRRA